MQVSIEVPNDPQFTTVSTRELPARGDKPARTIYTQEVVYHFGKYNIQPSSISLENPQQALKPGRHVADMSKCFSIGRFDRLEFDQYAVKIIPSESKA